MNSEMLCNRYYELDRVLRKLGVTPTKSDSGLYRVVSGHIYFLIDLIYLHRFGMPDWKSILTLIEVGVKLETNKKPNLEDQQLPNRELIGALTYNNVSLYRICY